MSGIIASDDRSPTLFDAMPDRSGSLMKVLDRINRRMGSGTIKFMGEGIRKDWAMKRGNVSQRYTTELNELAIAKA